MGWGSSCLVVSIFWRGIRIWLLGFPLKSRSMTMLYHADLDAERVLSGVWLHASCSFPFYSGRCEDHIHQTPVHSLES